MLPVNRHEPFELTAADSELRCRIHPAVPAHRNEGNADNVDGALPDPPTLIYLPGLHGDWTLLAPFRHALRGRCRLVEFAYPRRTDWRLDDYAGAVLAELARCGITRGWLLGESFSSQVVWGIAQAVTVRAEPSMAPAFHPDGIILVGGFVRHPLPWGVQLARRISGVISLRVLGLVCRAYGRWARRRCQRDGIDGREFDLFAARRTCALDRDAITSRYPLIRDNDFRPVARGVRWPVYLLTGAKDPIVPWPAVSRWLERHCPGFRERRIIWSAGHNVLLDAPQPSANQIVVWTKSVAGTSKNGEPVPRPLEPDLGQRRRKHDL